MERMKKTQQQSPVKKPKLTAQQYLDQSLLRASDDGPIRKQMSAIIDATIKTHDTTITSEAAGRIIDEAMHTLYAICECLAEGSTNPSEKQAKAICKLVDKTSTMPVYPKEPQADNE
jgi:hypothetical protein